MAMAAEPVVERLIGACGYQDPCPLEIDPLAAFDALAAQLSETPLDTLDGRQVGVVALQSAAQGAAATPFFSAQPFIESVAAAIDGNGDPLAAMVDQATFDAQVTILCNDEPTHPDPAAAATLATELAAIAPRAGLGVSATWGGVCQGWDPPLDPVEAIGEAIDVPILVIGSTGDPSTAYAWSQRMALVAPGSHLLTREGDGHTALFNTFMQGCTGAAVADFLLAGATAGLPESCRD
jgi:pimeloyl-ACP methyl ester carboxylesterase